MTDGKSVWGGWMTLSLGEITGAERKEREGRKANGDGEEASLEGRAEHKSG